MERFNRPYEEKRNFIRMKIAAPLDATIRFSGEDSKAVCKDLSGGGLLLESEKEFTVGDQVHVTVASEHGHNPTLTANAIVSRVQAQHDGQWTLGLEISEITQG